MNLIICQKCIKKVLFVKKVNLYKYGVHILQRMKCAK